MTTDSKKSTRRSAIRIASQSSLWDLEEDAQDDGSRKPELIEKLSTWAILNAHPELPTVGVKPGRSNWVIETWDLPRMETVYQAADLFSQRWRAYFALTHWAIEHGHPRVAQIEEGLASWVAWCKDATLDELQLMLEEVPA